MWIGLRVEHAKCLGERLRVAHRNNIGHRIGDSPLGMQPAVGLSHGGGETMEYDIRDLVLQDLTIYSDQDQVALGGEKRFIEEVPGCQGQPHVILEGGSHKINLVLYLKVEEAQIIERLTSRWTCPSTTTVARVAWT